MSSSTLVPTTVTMSRQKWLALIAIGGGLCFTIALLALHVLPTGINPVTQLISDYANGSFAYLQALAFIAWGIGWFALAVGLHEVIRSGRAVFAQVLFGIGALAISVNAIIPCDPGCANTTAAGMLHSVLAFPFFFGVLGGILLLDKPFKQDPRWQSFQPMSFIVSVVLVVAVIAFFVIRATNLPFSGIGQRVDLAVIMLWFLLTANQLRSLETHSILQ